MEAEATQLLLFLPLESSPLLPPPWVVPKTQKAPFLEKQKEAVRFPLKSDSKRALLCITSRPVTIPKEGKKGTSRKLDRPRKIKNFLSSLFFFSGIPSVSLFFLLLLLLHKAAIKMAGERKRKETSKKKRAREKVPHITSKSRALPLCIFQRGTKKEKKGGRYICAAPKSPDDDDDQLLQQALLLLLCPKGNDFLISPIWERGRREGRHYSHSRSTKLALPNNAAAKKGGGREDARLGLAAEEGEEMLEGWSDRPRRFRVSCPNGVNYVMWEKETKIPFLLEHGLINDFFEQFLISV